MAYVCGKCGIVHPPGALGCEDARRILKENAEAFNRRVQHHREHCRGCPDPTRHVRNLDEMDNPRQEPMRFAQQKITA